ncbi:hypothetical protein HYH02_011251 [Chlamydomonas schloesseri]|uniref:Uncharacterized protein n=1 Tax=Chlamydomonas schloesseri TaxID=2026947 RepID=A0A835T5Y1_9CHLO|nr:hypothetical protein HYH02_011251 [Chlamydomonas schloesseri]|eukprot:KAG2437612.1 hypothetical protein HYH02_011251 [Chlamydomonas schloesseri]
MLQPQAPTPYGAGIAGQPATAQAPSVQAQPSGGFAARFFQRRSPAAQPNQPVVPQPQPQQPSQQPATAPVSQVPISSAAGHAGSNYPGQYPMQANAPPPPAPQYLADMLTPGNSAARPLTITGASVPEPSRTRFAIFQRQDGPSPAPKPVPLPQQSAAQAFPPPHGPYGTGASWSQPPTGSSAATRDTQAVQELVGGNWIFLIFVPYFVATALQDTHLRIGLIVATATSAGVLVLGLLAFTMNLRKVFPHVLEVLMLVMYAVLLGVSYSSAATEAEVRRTYNFIVHSALAGTCLVSMLVCYPLGRQHVAELVHSLYMGHPDVHSVGLYTTAGLTAAFVSSCLLYLVPLCKGVDDEHWDVLNLIFRIIYPCVCTAMALLFARFLPDALLPNLAVVHGLNRRPPARLPAYLTDLLGLRPPAILDPTMYQSTSDAAAKVREGWALASRSAQPSPARTPRYGPGSGGGAPAPPYQPPPQQQYAAAGSIYAPAGLAAAGPAAGLMLGPGQIGYGDGYVGGPGAEAANFPSNGYPRQRLDLHGHKYLTYLAPGPPSPPPAAVFAVYDGHPNYELGHSRSAGGALDRPHVAVANPLMASVRGPGYDVRGSSYPHADLYGPKPYGGQGRVAAALRNFRRVGAEAAPADADWYPSSVPHTAARGRPFASAGGAGPYGVNLPLPLHLEPNTDAHRLYGQPDMPPVPNQLAAGMYAQSPDPMHRQPQLPVHPLQRGPPRPLRAQDRPQYMSEGGYGRAGGQGSSGGGFGLTAELTQPPAPGLQPPPHGPTLEGRVGSGFSGDGYGLGAEINKATAEQYDLSAAPPLGQGALRKPRVSVMPPSSLPHTQGFGLDAETDGIPSPAGLPPAGAGRLGGLPLPTPPRVGPSRLGPNQPAARSLDAGGTGGEGFGLDQEVEAEVASAGFGAGGGAHARLGGLGGLPQPGRREIAPLPPRPASKALGGGADAFGLDAEVGL